MTRRPAGEYLGVVLLYSGWLIGFVGLVGHIGPLISAAGVLLIGCALMLVLRRRDLLAAQIRNPPSWWMAPSGQDPRLFGALLLFIGGVFVVLGLA